MPTPDTTSVVDADAATISGLVLYAAYQASGGRIRLPHYSGDQIHAGTGIPFGEKEPGDLIFFGYPGASGPHHVAIYVGGDRILHAPELVTSCATGQSQSSPVRS